MEGSEKGGEIEGAEGRCEEEGGGAVKSLSCGFDSSARHDSRFHAHIPTVPTVRVGRCSMLTQRSPRTSFKEVRPLPRSHTHNHNSLYIHHCKRVTSV